MTDAQRELDLLIKRKKIKHDIIVLRGLYGILFVVTAMSFSSCLTLWLIVEGYSLALILTGALFIVGILFLKLFMSYEKHLALQFKKHGGTVIDIK